MKNSIIAAFLCFTSCFVFAQSESNVTTNDIIIGKDFRTGRDIKTREYVFSENIYSSYIDNSARLLTLQLRGAGQNGTDLNELGNLVLFDLPQKQIRWSKPLNYTVSNIDQYENILIKTTDNQSSCLNNEDGEILWESKNTIYHVNPVLKIGVGYRYNASGSSVNMLEGIDMNTGKSIWKREIKRDYGLNEISVLNDSVVLVAANGLHAVNLKTGLGWDYSARTGKKDHSATVTANIVNFAFSALMGADFEVTTGHDLYTDVVSNVLIDSTSIYMADKEYVVRVDHDGNVIWRKDLPSGLASKSSIFIKDSLLYMVNNGFAFMNGQLVNYGKPFFAAFKLSDGQKVFLSPLGYKKEQINAFSSQQDTLYLTSKNRIYKYSLVDGSEFWEQKIKADTLGELTSFAGKDVYVKSDSSLIKLQANDSVNVSVFTKMNKLLVFNNQLKLDKVIPVPDLYYCYLETRGYKFLENGNSSIIIDKDGKLVAELDISGNVVLRGNILYEIQGNSMVEIDINELIKN